MGQVLFSLAMDLGYLASNNHDVRRLLDEVGRGQLSGLGIVGQAAINYDLAIVRAWEKLWMLPDEISEKIEAARVAEVGAEA